MSLTATPTPHVVRLPNRRLTGWLLKVSLLGVMGWFAYQLANQFAHSGPTLQDSPIATIAILALALTVAACVAMRQQADLVYQAQDQRIPNRNAEMERLGLLGAIEDASDAVVIAGGDGIIRQFCFYPADRLPSDEALGQNHGRAEFGLGAALHKQVRDTVCAGSVWHGEATNQRKDGSWYVEEITVIPVRNGDGVIREFIAVRRDITVRKAATDALPAKAPEDAIMGRPERTEDLHPVETAALTNLRLEAQKALGPITSIADSAEDAIFGLARDGAVLKVLDRVNRGESPRQSESASLRRVGAPLPVSLSVPLVRDVQGNVLGLSAVARDISRLRHEPAALRHGEEFYQSLVAHLPDIVLVADEAGRPVFTSSNCQGVTGYTREEICRPDLWAARTHPDDLPRVEAANRALFQNGVPIDIEFRIERKDGTWIWLHSRAIHTYERDGQRYQDGLVSDVTERKNMQRKLAYQATHDTLTGLPNRATFEDRFQQALARARREGTAAALLDLDLDRFKRINDTLGRPAGDVLIQSAAQRLRACLRESETISRASGDRFIAVLGDIRDPQQAVKVAERILSALAAPFSVKGNEVFLTGSIGIALYPRDGEDPLSLQQAADSALRAAKRHAKRRIPVATPELSQSAKRRLAVETALHYALDRDELSLHYQPQFYLANNHITAVEARVRWYSPKLGLVPASVLIPVAEESGLIVPLGARVLREACRQAKHWPDARFGPIQVAVNTSAVQSARGDLTATVSTVLAETGLDAACLDVEVTETVIMQDLRETASQLRELKGLGVSVSLDDFGTGYSSLSYLEDLPFDNLKIDRKFVQRKNSADNTRTLVESIVGLAHGLGMRAVAEGVETAEQLDQLRAMGCDRAQSFMLAGPAPALTIQALLAQPFAPCAVA